MKGLDVYQKCTAAMRMVANGCAGDAVDEYIRIDESTTLWCQKRFCTEIVACFSAEYLRDPTDEYTEMLLRRADIMGLLCMLGSIDCCM